MNQESREVLRAVNQLPKLKALVHKYRHLKVVQSSLLKLSELASTVSDLNLFYPALKQVIKPLFNTCNFHIVLKNDWSELELAYCSDRRDNQSFAAFNHQDWLRTLTGVVFESKTLLHCDSKQQKVMQQEQDIVLINAQYCKFWLGAPLKRGQNVIGVIALKNSVQDLAYDDKYKQLLSFISEYIVIAIDRVRSRELLELNIQQRTRKLTEINHQLQSEIAERQKSERIHKALLEISEITANVDDEKQFFSQIHCVLQRLICADNFYVALLNKDNQQIEFPYFVDENCHFGQSSNTGLTEFILRLARPALIHDKQVEILNTDGVIEQRTFNERNNKSLKATSWLGAPLIIQDDVVGVIAVQSYTQNKTYQQSDLELMRFLSQHIASAIHRKKTAAELKHHNEELEVLVSNRTHALQESNSNLRLQVEERRKVEERLYFEAHHDALTKLPNRTLFSDRLNQAIKHLRRHTNNRFAVLFIDLDRFKLINDTLGHQAGDEFLIEISTRILKCIRDNDILARLGGDEFVILLDSLQSNDDAEEIAGRVIEAIQQPFNIQSQELHSNASIGIAICDKNYKNADELLRDADAAMYQAKAFGRGRYVFFDESMREQLLASMTLEQELRAAVTKQQFVLHYQEISDLRDTSVIGFEAYLRWQHPERGILPPDEFIQMAEEIGLIAEIEQWVVQQACLQLENWKNQPEFANAFVSINLSGKHIAQPNNVGELIRLIKRNTRQPERLILEFTERAFNQQQQEQMIKGLNRLKKLGVKLALDDYGAGLSSLNFLSHYPFAFIKLDKSFIRTVSHNDKNLQLIKMLTAMGENFGFRIVAEGIESQELLTKLKSVGCEYGQGYFIGMPAAEAISHQQTEVSSEIASCA